MEIDATRGRLRLTAESITHSILDALGEELQAGDPNGHVAEIMARATRKFSIPEMASSVISERLRTRLPRVLKS